jgi:CheY-like chemotaxis protein
MAASAKVLLIDDDPDFRAAVRAPLEAHGYTVLEAESGDQGLRMLREQQPDAVLVDIMMESASEGYGVTQAIRWQEAYRDFRDLPIIMVSSIEETPDERFAMAGEVEMIRPDIYLTKPLDIPRLLEVLKTVTAPS